MSGINHKGSFKPDIKAKYTAVYDSLVLGVGYSKPYILALLKIKTAYADACLANFEAYGLLLSEDPSGILYKYDEEYFGRTPPPANGGTTSTDPSEGREDLQSPRRPYVQMGLCLVPNKISRRGSGGIVAP